MTHPLRSLAVLPLLLVAAACATTPAASPPPPAASDAPKDSAAPKDTAAPKESAPPAKEEKESHSFLEGVLLYLPNRFIDVFDMVRFGANVGPGLGVDCAVTEALQAQAFTHLSVGVGLQGLRHSPVFAGAEAGLGVGPLGGPGDAGMEWYRSESDIRVGAYAAVVGAHVAIDPVEILDLVLGFLTIDIRDDDL